MTVTPTDLTNDATIAELLGLLPDDAGQGDLTKVYRRRTEQLAATIARTDGIAARLTEIAKMLPDASSKAREALVAERTTLVVERLSSGEDRRVAATNFATSLLAWSAAVIDAAEAERRAMGPEITRLEAEHRAALGRLQAISPTDDAYARLYESFKQVDAAFRPVEERYTALRRLQETVGKQVAQALVVHDGQRIKINLTTGRPISDPTPTFVAHVAGEEAA